MILVPLKTVSGMNAREHWRKRAARVKNERAVTAWQLVNYQAHSLRPALPCVVTLTRIGPSNGLDPFDNLPSSLKGVADEIAAWLGVDDRRSDLVRYECRQERGKEWGVRIEFQPAAVAA